MQEKWYTALIILILKLIYMKQFLSWFGKKVANAIVTAVLFMVAVLGIVYALSYPSTPPAGEVAGGNFMNYFNKILVNT